MKRKVPEYAHECSSGHWTWSIERPLEACPHMVKGRKCQGTMAVKGRKQVTVEQ